MPMPTAVMVAWMPTMAAAGGAYMPMAAVSGAWNPKLVATELSKSSIVGSGREASAATVPVGEAQVVWVGAILAAPMEGGTVSRAAAEERKMRGFGELLGRNHCYVYLKVRQIT